MILEKKEKRKGEGSWKRLRNLGGHMAQLSCQGYSETGNWYPFFTGCSPSVSLSLGCRVTTLREKHSMPFSSFDRSVHNGPIWRSVANHFSNISALGALQYGEAGVASAIRRVDQLRHRMSLGRDSYTKMV